MSHRFLALLKFLASICFITTILVAAHAHADQPEPPKGFSWQDLDGAEASVLVPKNWYFSKTASRDAFVYRVTKEKLTKEDAPFLTGITINIVREVPKKSGVKPSLYAIKYVADYMENVDVVEKPKIDEAAGMQRVTCQVVKKLPKIDKEKLFRVRVTTMANDKSGTLYIMIFGTPQDEWDETYKIGKQLFNPILLDPEF